MPENLVYLLAATLAKTCPLFQWLNCLRSGYRASTDVIPSAIRFDCVLRYAERKSDFAIAIAIGAEIRYFPLLAIRHFLYTSICGTPANRYQVIPSDSYVLGNAKAPNFEQKIRPTREKSPVGHSNVYQIFCA